MLQTSLIGLFFGTVGTTIGGLIGIILKRNSNKFISFILSFASGLMLSIVCFNLIPEAMEISNIHTVILGISLGVAVMILCDIIVKNIFNQKTNEEQLIKNKKNYNSLLKTGIIITLGIALHNIPEGLAIGSGFETSAKLGLSLAIAICMHDVPERNSNGNTTKKWRNEQNKNNNLYNTIRNCNRTRSNHRSSSRKYINRNNSNIISICRRSNVICSIRRTNSRIQQTIQWKNKFISNNIRIPYRNTI